MQFHGCNGLSSVFADGIVQATQRCLCQVPLDIWIALGLVQCLQVKIDLRTAANARCEGVKVRTVRGRRRLLRHRNTTRGLVDGGTIVERGGYPFQHDRCGRGLRLGPCILTAAALEPACHAPIQRTALSSSRTATIAVGCAATQRVVRRCCRPCATIAGGRGVATRACGYSSTGSRESLAGRAAERTSPLSSGEGGPDSPARRSHSHLP
eukprot:SAG25_NODE_1256_length_3486_cov_8.791911_3_plen_210_part_00